MGQTMSRIDIIRAWKDEDYRSGLTDAQRALSPAHPAGLIELNDEQMKSVLGAGPATGVGGSSGCIHRCTCPVVGP
jgi:mersacidin/lichenicidin family type 2 lantibiotic